MNNNPIGLGLVKFKPEFEKLTGITVKVDGYQEQQMRQRLVTVMNARSDEVDLFMSLPSREGQQFAKAGWYADLGPFIKGAVAKDYDFKDLSAGMVADATYDGKVMGLPLNVEGPVVYYRKDLLQKCNVALPKTLAEMEAAAAKLKACDANDVALRQPRPEAGRALHLQRIPAQPRRHVHEGPQVASCAAPPARRPWASTARLLKDFGPPGVVNYSFPQISSLYKEGRAALAFESTNELRNVMDGGARLATTPASCRCPPAPAAASPP